MHHSDNVAPQDFKLIEVGTSKVLLIPHTQLTLQQEFQGSRLLKIDYLYCPFSSLNQLFMELDKHSNRKG